MVNLTNASITAAGETTTRTFSARFGDIVNVKGFGAIGDGINDDTAEIQAALDYAYGTAASPHGTASVTSNRSVFFPAGNYKITSSLTLRSVRGANIFGSGRFTSKIENTAGGNVFTTNGFEYSRVGSLQLVTSGTGVCFDLDWDGTGPTALQSNTFYDMFFEAGAFGCRIGNSGSMGSENLFLNCFFANHTTAGLATKNGNALQNSVIGGDFQGCTIGVWAGSGSIPVIIGVGFQQTSTNRDIQIDNSQPDAYFVSGCRSESQYFLHVGNGPGMHVSGCVQTNATAGTFLFYETGNVGSCLIDSCRSVNGVISSFSNGKIWIRGGSFDNASFVPASMGVGGRIMEWDLGPIAVASLPAAATHLQGLRQSVTNGSTGAMAFGDTVSTSTGTGVALPVYCTGSAWLVG